jgi:hypothetical protein
MLQRPPEYPLRYLKTKTDRELWRLLSNTTNTKFLDKHAFSYSNKCRLGEVNNALVVIYGVYLAFYISFGSCQERMLNRRGRCKE